MGDIVLFLAVVCGLIAFSMFATYAYLQEIKPPLEGRLWVKTGYESGYWSEPKGKK